MDHTAAYSSFVAVDNWLFTHNGDVYNAALIADGVALGRARLFRANGRAIIVDTLAQGELHPAELAARLEELETDAEALWYGQLVSGCAGGDVVDQAALRAAVDKALNRG